MGFQDHLEKISNEAQSYVEAKFEQARLSTVERTTNSISTILSWLVIAGIAFICFLLLSLLAVVALAQLLESYTLSLLIVFGFYLILFILVIVFQRNLLFKPIKNQLLGVYLETYKNEKSDEDE